MRIGLAGAGRIGAFHASTLSARDVVQVDVTEACEISRTTGRAVEMNEIGDAT